jgi:uncharacterized protein (TIGR04255 family)
MKIPKKIYPDNIKDSIVEIKFNSVNPTEINLGLFFNALDESYFYSNRNNSPMILPDGRTLDFTINGGNLFYNDTIKFEFKNNSIIFNCMDSYKGWDDYIENINKTLKQIFKTGVISSFISVGVRYISEYPDVDLKNITKFKFGFGFPDIASESFSFRTNFQHKGMKIALNLNSKVMLSDLISKNEQIAKLSLIDIDIIKSDINCENVESLLEVVNQCHTMEKEFFFGLLNTDYFESLKKEF